MPGRLLIVAEASPPLGGSGVYRTLKFLKYLPQHGWSTVLLTGDSESGRPAELDPSLLAEMPAELEVRRVPYCRPFARLFRLSSSPDRNRSVSFNSEATPTETPAAAKASLPRRIFRTLRSMAAAPVGDPLFYWSMRCARSALQMATGSSADAVYVSASPFSSLLVGLRVKRRLGLPFIADFRDPWTLFHPNADKGLRFRLNRHWEKKVLREADAVICNHEPMQHDFERIEPRCSGKCLVITNGFDPDDFTTSPPPLSPNLLLHVGMAWEDSPHPVLRSLASLKGQGRLHPEFRVEFLGGLPPSSLRMIRDLQLSCVVRVTPRVPRERAVSAMRSAEALLLLPGARSISTVVPGKTYEYVASGRPVLCVAPDGLVPGIIQRTGVGITRDPMDKSGLEETLQDISSDASAWARQHHRPNQQAITRYDRRSLTGAFRSTVQTADPALAISKMLDGFRTIQDSTPTAGEIATAQSYYTGSFPISYSSSGGKLRHVTIAEAYRLGTDWLKLFPEKVSELTTDDLARSAREHLQPDNLYVVIVGNVTVDDIDLPGLAWLD